MLPIQEIEIRTKNGRIFHVHLEKWEERHFKCKLVAINLCSQFPADVTFDPSAHRSTASDAFKSLVVSIRTALTKLDASDSIAQVNNPCNTEFVPSEEQETVLGQGVVVQVNGINA